MKGKIKMVDSVIEISASVFVITLFFSGTISLAYALLGIVISLSLFWPSDRKTPSSLS